MARLPITVSQDQQEKWHSFADERPEFGSTADLVRTAVETYITADENADGTLSEEEVELIMEYLENIESSVTTNQNLLEDLRDDSPTQDDIQDLAIFQEGNLSETVRSAVQQELEEAGVTNDE